MRVLIKESNKKYELIETDGTLKSLQKIVGGNVETTFLSEGFLKRNIVTIVNEEGKLLGLEPTLVNVHNGEIIDILVGQIIFCGVDGEGFSGLTDEQITYILYNTEKESVSNIDGTKIDVIYV